MKQLSINPGPVLAGAFVMLAIGAGAGWVVNGWRLGHFIADLKAEAATQKAETAGAALADLEAGLRRVNAAARSAQTQVGSVNAQLDQIRKDYKNAPSPPLPADCRPDDGRVRTLTAAAGAVDKAIAGPGARSAVQGERTSQAGE